MADRTQFRLSPTALFRYQVVSAVEARLLSGWGLAQAVREICQLTLQDLSGNHRPVSERSVYRWLKAYRRHGIEGLDLPRRPKITDSTVLSKALLEFLRVEKARDPEASIPDLVLRARQRGILAPEEIPNRISIWRACRRMELPTRRAKKIAQEKRRFSYPNRMLMVLADGKHFRAGVKRLKRVALNFLDDATRFGLTSLVGTSENTELFLHGLFRTISRYGLMTALYLDRGPGFISDDTLQICARLGIRLIHGAASYPEGHGKIERFHRTQSDRLLRGLDKNPEVDPDPSALTLRLSHWMHQLYNHSPHESLELKTPLERWERDPRPLEFPQDPRWFENQFVLSLERTVSADNVVPFESTLYEVPSGYEGQRILLFRDLLSQELFVDHRGNRVVLHPLDPVRNAYAKRASSSSDSPQPVAPPPTTAANLAFGSDFAPLVDDQGNFPLSKESDHENH
jgi:transposase InsO family protein